MALQQFLRRYVPAMRSHLRRRRGWREDQVGDVLQSSIAPLALTPSPSATMLVVAPSQSSVPA